MTARSTSRGCDTTQNQLTGGVSGAAFLLGNILCWAAVPVLLRYLTHSVDAWTANGFRYPMAAVLYWPVLAIAWRSGHLNRQVIGCCIVPSFLALGGQVFWALAPYYLPAGAIGFLMRFSLVFALVGAVLVFPDEMKLLTLPSFYIGLVLCVIGFIVMAISKVQFDADVTPLGIGIMLLCSVFFGFYGISIRYFLRGIHPLVGFGIVSHAVSIGTLAAMFMVGRYEDLAVVTGRDWLVLIGSSVLGIALGHYFLYSAVVRLGAAISSAAQTLIPFLTVLLASRFLGESMSSLEWIAGVTMVAGAAALLDAQNRLFAKAG